MSPRDRRALMLGALWPGLGQLALGTSLPGTLLAMGGLALGLAVLDARVAWTLPAVLAWLTLWAGGEGELLNRLVFRPLRQERADRLLRSGMAYLLQGDSVRACSALSRADALGGSPAAALYLVQAERAQGRHAQADRRLTTLQARPRAAAWRWEIARAKETGR